MRRNVKWAIVDWNLIRQILCVRVYTNIWFELENTYTFGNQSARAETGRELIHLNANVHKNKLLRLTYRAEINIAIFIGICEDFCDIFITTSKQGFGPPE